MRRISTGCLGRDQPVLAPVAVYVQAANTGNEPGLGSVTVPLKDPVDVIVPRSSIADEDPADAAMERTVKPVLRVTEPLSGRTSVVGGFCQVLVPVPRVPSASTSKNAVNTWPSASDPLEQVRVLVGRTVNDQFPVASARLTPPVPPMPIRVLALFSQAATDTSKVRQNNVGRT